MRIRKNVIKCASLCVLVLMMCMSSKAQEMYLELKMDFNVGDLKYRSSNNILGENGGLGEVRNFSIGASAQITEHIFIKSTLSTSNFDSELDIQWNSFGDSYAIDGKIRGQQTVFEFLPELRFFKNNLIFINAGIGVVDLTQGEFCQGEAMINGAEWEVQEFRGYYHHFAANLGVNIQHDIVGVIVELGYRNSGFLESTDTPFNMRFNSIGLKLGVSYRLRDARNKDLEVSDNL